MFEGKVQDFGGLNLKEYSEINEKNLKQIREMKNSEIEQEILDLKKMLSPAVLKNIQSRKIFLKNSNQ